MKYLVLIVGHLSVKRWVHLVFYEVPTNVVVTQGPNISKVIISFFPQSPGGFSLNQRCIIRYELEIYFVLAYKRKF